MSDLVEFQISNSPAICPLHLTTYYLSLAMPVPEGELYSTPSVVHSTDGNKWVVIARGKNEDFTGYPASTVE